METLTTSSFDSHNPVDGTVLASYPNTSAADVNAAVERARAASVAWQALGFRGRRKVLLKWASEITKQVDEIAEIVRAETGKPISDATLEATLALGHLAWAAKHAESVLAKQHRPSGLLMFNMKTNVTRVPMGVVGVIGPWNYPIFTPMGSIAYALAAGNTVVFKPSEFTPGVGRWLADSFANIAPFADIFTCVTGLPETGKALTESAVDKVSFTGSTRTAKKVAAACAERMVPLVLECGGKDPVLVAADADIDRAAEYALWSAMSNAGQTCIGAERVYVVNEVADKFIVKITELAKDINPGKDGNYGPATMPSQLNVIQSHINDAAAKGAKFVIGGVDSVKAPFVEPVIMVNVPENSTAVTEETFGPTLVINRTADIAEAIRLANATRYGLAASVWSKRNGEKIASQLYCGMVSVNSVITFAAIASVPFGGVKDSGYGRIHGPEGLLEFTFPRTVVKTIFNIPIVFTSFGRTKFADKIIMFAMKNLRSRGIG
ncbi:MAG: aldehyde dehydrogenase family protein [Actinobacteria bacterium]|nr:aldehyde dehydrogenase family protein [Actinomycetota bacterium]MDA2982246.1 aldehyde dehydrogenase family protein [Actinomycetota bacterium]MDA2996501.1 aldehyde dehydrogenase family protein [Actinomycetota bacterium]